MTPVISIVMPVYNVEKYLRECLDSVRAQTFTDWECICVDDGSTDGSVAILDEYASKDSRFRVVRREHSNAGAVRNFGMAQASGVYLMFLDADDIFSPWLLSTLTSKAEETDAEIVACSAIWFKDGSPIPEFSSPGTVEWRDRTPDSDWINRPLDVGTMPWNKVIRRCLIEEYGIRFLEQSSTNDLTFMALALSLSGRTFQTQTPLIGYRQHGGSIQSGKSKNPLNYLKAIDSYREQMAAFGVWQKLSHRAMLIAFEFYAGTAIWELETQSSFRGYLVFYAGIRSMARDFTENGVFPEQRTDAPLSLVRFRSIARGGSVERLRALIEALLSPILGGWSRRWGLRLRVARRLRQIVNRVFDPKKRKSFPK